MNRSQGVILVGDGRAEQGHEAVAEKLIDGSFVAVDLAEHQLEGSVHEGVGVLGIEPFGQRGEAGDVDEEHGDELALALEHSPRGEDLLGQVLGRVGTGGCEALALRRGARRPHRVAAFLAEPVAGAVGRAALRARDEQAQPAVGTELRIRRSFNQAARTLHAGASP